MWLVTSSRALRAHSTVTKNSSNSNSEPITGQATALLPSTLPSSFDTESTEDCSSKIAVPIAILVRNKIPRRIESHRLATAWIFVFSFSSIGLHNAAAFSQPIQTINSPGDKSSKKQHMHLREARKTSIPKKRGRLLSPLLPPQRSLACGSSDF
jgi:hypothetical protein